MKPVRSFSAPVSRRDALVMLGSIGSAAAVAKMSADQRIAANRSEPLMVAEHAQPFVLPTLGYPFDALEPHIDARTMEIHLTKHHKAYVDNANKALEQLPGLKNLSAERLLSNLEVVPQSARMALQNNVGGHVNHSLFWELLMPGGSSRPSGALADAINSTFGSFDAFKSTFSNAASTRFGSGWAWLVAPRQGGLRILSTANQDSPLMDNAAPVIGLDVWEHAYYLKYQNKRADYIQAFWKILNWDVAGRLFASVR